MYMSGCKVILLPANLCSCLQPRALHMADLQDAGEGTWASPGTLELLHGNFSPEHAT